MRVLLVEDDELLGYGLRAGLTQHGDAVEWVKDGKSALQLLQSQSKENSYDVTILDISLPKLSGTEVLKQIRAKNIKTPVLVLTAHDRIDDRVKGLDMGADDYVCKPFDLSELCARMRALQRRTGTTSRAIPVIAIGNVKVDPGSRRVFVGDKQVEISRREFVLLHLLMENAGRVLTREQISQNLYGWGDEVDSNALEVHIHNIRRKVGNEFIETIRGVGYLIEKPKDE
jgi:two-component system, OmpR family, response regulator QseB